MIGFKLTYKDDGVEFSLRERGADDVEPAVLLPIAIARMIETCGPARVYCILAEILQSIYEWDNCAEGDDCVQVAEFHRAGEKLLQFWDAQDAKRGGPNGQTKH
jgi:hypothetical protein